MTLSLHIHGAAGTVTGSCHRLVTPRGELLIDCGMFQGPKSLRALELSAVSLRCRQASPRCCSPTPISTIRACFPKLALAGFRGRASATAATRDLLRWLLPDAGAIQENDVERLNRRNARRAEPGGDGRSIPGPMPRPRSPSSSPQPYDRWFEPMPGVRARMRNAGHILGSAFIELEVDAAAAPVRLVFSGDVGPARQGSAARSGAARARRYRPGRVDLRRPGRASGCTEAERRAMLGHELADRA